jgi:uncharacterized protein
VTITGRLKSDLVVALRQQDPVRVSTIRSLISAIDNAGAVPAERLGYDSEPKIGFGHDVDRRTVTDDEITLIISAERDELVAARDNYRELGETAHAEELERRADIVTEYLG